MLISTKQTYKILKDRNGGLQLNIDGDELALVQSTGYQGVNIDSWYLEVCQILPTIRKLENSILRCCWPHFRYCYLVWGCCGCTGINHLQKLQNRAARIVTSSSIDAPSRPLVNELVWKTIDELVDNESKVMVYKSQHQLAPQYLSSVYKKLKSLLKEPL